MQTTAYIELPGAQIPHDIRSFLTSSGWQPAGNDVWSHPGHGVYNASWEQAAVYEMFRKFTLGVYK